MTDVSPNSQQLGEQFLKSLDKSHVGAAASRLFAASIGDMIVLQSRSSAHKHYSLADIEWMDGYAPTIRRAVLYCGSRR
jgi:hypothetical protein